MHIALAQSNFTVGDISGNVAKIAALHARANREQADLVIFPEMAVTGYPPEDLVLRKGFQNEAMQGIEALAAFTKNGTAMLLGGLWREGDGVYNTIFLLDNGEILTRQYKHNLPNYGVFDEKRVFAAGKIPEPVVWRGVKLGLLVCEDMWGKEAAQNLAAGGAELLVTIHASPYEIHKHEMRIARAQERVKETGLPLIYVNQIGGQDELVFDGRSFIIAADGRINTRLRSFSEDFTVSDWQKEQQHWECAAGVMESPHSSEENIYRAMALGLRDYVEKNRFPGVVLGLSGGIDSALTAAVAVDALGAERVHAIMMPSPYTSADSLEDAAKCAHLLGIKLDIISISPAMLVLDEMLAPVFSGRKTDITEENIQSRLRGNILMAVSNKGGNLVLTTGNKSEMAVGYATLYGDMCGGYNVLKDIYKTTVYALAGWRNGQGSVIPERILTKAPSAELKPNQTDQDSLPPYAVLDAILLRLVEQQLSVREIAAQGYDVKIVERVATLLARSEYKRRQAPPGVKITPISFGRDRRYPLTNGWNA